MAESILVFCAHPDDEIFGIGGTVAKYASEKKRVRAVVFTMGEESHPWQKEEITQEIRLRESKKAAGIVGYKHCIYLGVPEANFMQHVEQSNAINKVQKLIEKYKPKKIFTHSLNDHHPVHKQVHRIVRAVVANLKKPIDLYAFDIWTVVPLKERNNPRLIVDVTDTFHTKVRALKVFKSQQISLMSLLWSVYAKALVTGMQNSTKYAEAFYKVPLYKDEVKK